MGIHTLPYGVMTEIDCDAAAFRILEAAVIRGGRDDE